NVVATYIGVVLYILLYSGYSFYEWRWGNNVHWVPTHEVDFVTDAVWKPGERDSIREQEMQEKMIKEKDSSRWRLAARWVVLAAMATILRSDLYTTNRASGIDIERAAAMEQDFLERQKASAKLERHTLKACAHTLTPVYIEFSHRSQQVNFHVISEDDTEAGGSILHCPLDRESSILRQVDVLNEAYHDLGISWTLGNITRSVDAEWFNNVSKGSAQDIAMKKALHGSAADLNVYTVKLTENVLGYATSPLEYSIDPLLDGVVLRSATVPENDFTSLLITTAQVRTDGYPKPHATSDHICSTIRLCLITLLTGSDYTALTVGISISFYFVCTEFDPPEDIPSFNSTNWTPHFTFNQAPKASELLKNYRGIPH
ncbi:hypothetical protein H0H93_006682, partial [Arthromyces matolae]